MDLKMKEAIAKSVVHSMNPYIAFDPRTLEDYKNELIAAGFEPGELDSPEELYEQWEEDIRDDFQNCGGSMLARIHDLSKIYPLLGKYQEQAVKYLTVQIIKEFESWD